MTESEKVRPATKLVEKGSIVTAKGIAELFGRSDSWFYEHRLALEKEGFPKKDKLLAGWHRKAIEAWLEKRSGVAHLSQLEEERAAAYADIATQGERRLALRNR